MVSADGASASKVRVCARRGGPQHRLIREDIEPLICSETDASGSYELGLAPGVWWVFAWQRELLPDGDTVALRASKPHGTLDLSLRRGGRAYAGKLVDLDGKPIHGAQVEALSRIGERLRISASVSTDAEGHYELWSAADAELEFRAVGYSDAIPRDESTHVLLPESVITGKVLDKAGQPVAGARVVRIHRFGPTFGDPRDATRTDADGNFRLQGLEPSDEPLLAMTDDALAVLEDVYVGYAQTRKDVVLELDRPLQDVRARVVSPSGDPIAGCLVMLSPEGAERAMPIGFWSDQEGLIDGPGLPDRSLVTGISCAGWLGTPPYEPIAVAQSGAATPSLSLERGRVLRGRLLDAAGQPLAGRRVFAQPAESDSLPSEALVVQQFMEITHAETNADGRFELIGFAPGQYELVVDDPSVPPEPTITITDDAITEVTFTTPATGRIEVRTSDARAGQRIHVERCSPAGPRRWSASATTDARGLAVIEHALPGQHRVGLEYETSCVTDRGLELELAAGETQRVTVESAPSHELVVRVLTASGEPAVNTLVIVEPSYRELPERFDWAGRTLDAFHITDAEGRIRARIVAGELDVRWRVIAARPGEWGAQLIELDAAELELRLRASQ